MQDALSYLLQGRVFFLNEDWELSGKLAINRLGVLNNNTQTKIQEPGMGAPGAAYDSYVSKRRPH